MGIIAWIILGLAAGLLANMLIPGKRSQGLILTCLIGIAGALGGGWVATKLFHIHSPARVLQPVHLAHRHRRVRRPAARLPPAHRAILWPVPLVRTPLTHPYRRTQPPPTGRPDPESPDHRASQHRRYSSSSPEDRSWFLEIFC
jgi:uncharacterized membrane protein YeaQ/YmgE (transglycosylase-associated protein family)